MVSPRRVLNFSKAHVIRDPKNDSSPLTEIYAAELRGRFASALEKAVETAITDWDGPVRSASNADPIAIDVSPMDAERAYRLAAVEELRGNQSFWQKVQSEEGIRWGTVQRLLADYAPAFLEDDQERFEWARNVVKEALDTLLGSKDIDYTTEKRAGDKLWIKVKRRPASNTAQDDLFETESRDDEPPF